MKPLHGRHRRKEGAAHTVDTLADLSELDRETECWNWTMSVNTHGYGQARHEGKSYAAHRLMFILSNPGVDITGKTICHHCDNRSCINPGHLYAGTPKDNMDDMRNRGRAKYPGGAKGEKHRDAKLTEESVREIRSKSESKGYRKLAKEYGVDRTTIKLVVRRLTWKHVQ